MLSLSTICQPSTTPRKASSFRARSTLQTISAALPEQPSAQSTLQLPHCPAAKVDSKAFVIAMRKAKTKEAQVLLLTSYGNYEPSQPIGVQIDNAMRKAMANLSPRKETESTPIATVAYVAGVPNHTKRHIQELVQRKESITTLLEESLYNANNHALPTQKRIFGAQSVARHEQTLEAINQELNGLLAK